MNINTLPDVEFVSADKEKVVKYLTDTYEKITGRTLAKADPVRLFILTIAYVDIMLLNKINYTGKQNLLKYAEGGNLDNLAALVGVERIPASEATVTVTFTMQAAQNNNVLIPKGTRVSVPNSQVYFSTDVPLVITSGNTSGIVTCTCQTAGDAGNGITAGMITNIVDPVAYIARVENTTISEGGADTESDEHLRERTQEAIESFSTAGPSGAYEYFAKAASSLIGECKAVSPEAGSVDVYILEENGEIPGEELIQTVSKYLSDSKRRPLTDKVTVKTPKTTSYDINMTYYISTEDADANTTIANINNAVSDYISWQDTKMGRDINPDKLTQLCLKAGAKRVEIKSPVFTHIASGLEKDGSYIDNYAVGVAKNIGNNAINYGGTENE